jgi:hypothetical protein
MVAFQAFRRSGDFAVHAVGFAFPAVWAAGGSHGVEFVANTRGAPLVPAQPIEIVGIDDGEFAPTQLYATVRAAEAQPAVHEYRPDQQTFESIRNCKGQNDLDVGFLR